MQCPECGAELIQTDTYFRGRPGGCVGTAGHGYFYPPTDNYKVIGNIYECRNSDGFDGIEEAREYAHSLCDIFNESDWESVVCESAVHNGHFYTDEQGELHKGYPC